MNLVELSFDVGGIPATFVRDDWTGKTELRTANDVRELQSPGQLSTHVSVSTRTVWNEVVGDHAVEVEKVRPRMFGALRPTRTSSASMANGVAEASGK